MSPTDPIAATSILNKPGLSKSVTSIIEGESLFNDGNGVVHIPSGKRTIEPGDEVIVVSTADETIGCLDDILE